MTHYSCIILAGGEGKRTGGKDKGLIVLDGKPMIEHVISNISHSVSEIVISANRNLETYQHYGYEVISDSEDTYRGPMAGLAATLPHCNNEWILVLPCDMPYLPQNLIEKLATHKDKSQICIVEHKNKFQLVFLMHKSLHHSIQQSLDANELRLMQWIKSHNPEVTTFDNHSNFTNLNTLPDL